MTDSPVISQIFSFDISIISQLIAQTAQKWKFIIIF